MELTPSPSHSKLDPVTAKFRVILRGLQQALGNYGLAPLIGLLLHRRISVMLGQMERILERFRAGALVQRGPCPQNNAPVARKPSTKPGIRLPRNYGWLLASGKHHAAYFTDHLRRLMDEPDMVALVSASPQAARVLRPLLRALAVEVPWIAEAPHTAKRPTCARNPRKPRPKSAPWRYPLPRGVLAAARRHKQLDKALLARDEQVLKMAQARGV